MHLVGLPFRQWSRFAGRTVFAQLADHVPPHEFHKCVARYDGNYKFRGFSCLDQFLCLAFAQLTFRESLRDIEACLRSVENKLYHMGFRGKVSRSTLADANEAHDWRTYADFTSMFARTVAGLEHAELNAVADDLAKTAGKRRGEFGERECETLCSR